MKSERTRTGRRLLVSAMAVVGLSLAAPVVSAPAAHAIEACADEVLRPAQQAALPYVFTGTVSDVAESAKDGVVTRIYTVKVDRWWRGDLPERVRVTSPKSASECGLRGVRAGSQTYVFFGSEGEGNQVLALSNQGTREADDATVRKLDQLTGTKAQEPVPAATESPAPEVSTTPTVLDDSEPPSVMDSITVPVVVVLAGLLVFGAGALLGRRPH